MAITIEEAQQRVDEWIRTYGVRYFNELTNMAILTEEVGEVARIMSRRYGEQSFKKGENGDALADELASERLRLVRFAEGPCAQVMHRGPYDDEPATVAALTAFIAEQGFATDIVAGGESPEGHRATATFDAGAVLTALDADGAVPVVRLHHEIYLGDPRRTKPEKLRTVIRHPVRKR